MSEALELRISTSLIVDELDLDGLHRRDSKNGFKDTRSETSQKLSGSTQVTFRIDQVKLNLFEASEARIKVQLGF